MARVSGQFSSPFSKLLGSTLEAIIHELLYSRSIYPPGAFVLQRHLGVRFHASHVPQVGDYVADFLRVAVPSIVSGAVTCLSMVILEEEVARGGGGEGIALRERTGRARTAERFVFRFQMDRVIGHPHSKQKSSSGSVFNDAMKLDDGSGLKDAVNFDRDLTMKVRSQLERYMRECLLRTITLRRRKRKKDETAATMSFKLCLHVAGDDAPKGNDETENGDGREAASCPVLTRAVKRGKWLQSENASSLFSSTENGSDVQEFKKGLFRPIKDLNLPICGMRMQMGMEVDPFR